jgi:nucleotide-binding universal stress UspA family protein
LQEVGINGSRRQERKEDSAMIDLKVVLVPVDFSAASFNAIRYGLSAAMRFRARLVLAHIVPAFPVLDYPSPSETYDIEKQAFAEARQRLPELIPAAVREQVDFYPVVKGGDVRKELLGMINDEKANLVVMGSHGHRPVERFFLGSTVDAMLRRVPVPILTVRAADAKQESQPIEPAPIRRIVYATDCSENAKEGLRYSAELSRTLDAELTVLHVIPKLSYSDQLDMEAVVDSITPHHLATQRVQQLVEPERTPDLRLQTAVVEGMPFDEINRFAEDTKADIITLNMQSKSFLDRALIGSTVERVIRSARVPVLSIPTCDPKQFAKH